MKLKKLEETLTKIWSGELKYDSSCIYLCGDSADLAGWYFKDNKENLESFSSWIKENPTFNTWDWCQKDIGFSYVESLFFFDFQTTRELQEICLQCLKDGRRLDIESKRLVHLVDIQGKNIVLVSNLVLTKFNEFFKETGFFKLMGQNSEYTYYKYG